MILGSVNSRSEVVVRLRLRGPKGAETDEDVVVDTGFSESLTLPLNIVGYLDLDFHQQVDHTLADETVTTLDVHKIEIEWNGVWRQILATCVGSSPMMGMRLLAGHHLSVEAKPGGAVEITPLP